MPRRNPDHDAALRAVMAVAREQAGVVTRAQALELGMTASAIRWRLKTEQWRDVFSVVQAGRRPAVYATHRGELTATARLWAAVLVCGADATLSHESAAELHGIIDQRGRRAVIHVTVPAGHHIRPPNGIRLHYSRRLDESRHPALAPPRTRVEDTVVDLTQTAASLDRASALIADAVQRRLTTHERIAASVADRRKLRWRSELLELCGVVGSGAQTLIELRYVNGVERAHGLPEADRQVRLKGPTRDGPKASQRIVDNRYPGHGVIVELDGRRGHTGDGVFRDMWRDNAALLQGDRTLRFGHDDVSARPCETAAIVAVVLDVEPRPCGPECLVLAMIAELSAA